MSGSCLEAKSGRFYRLDDLQSQSLLQLIFVGDQLIFFRKSAVTTEFLTFFLGVLIFFVISHPMTIIFPVNLDIFSADSMTFSVYSMTFFMRFKFFSPV